MKALSDQSRLTIVQMLLLRQYCVGGLARTLKISEAAVSQHLKVLKQVGIVTGTKRGYFVHYQVEKEALRSLATLLLAFSEVEQTGIGECQTRRQTTCTLCNEKHPNKEIAF